MAKSAEEKVAWFVDFQSVIDHWYRGIFGVPLLLLLERQKKDHPEAQVPLIVTQLCEALQDAPVESLCLTSDPYSINKLKNAINSQEVDLSQYSPVIVASALRHFFLDMPQPLIDRDWVRPILHDIKQGRVVPVATLKELYNNLPQAHRSLLQYILEFSLKTKISPNIFAITWGHCILRSVNEAVNNALNIQETEMVETMLVNFDELFLDRASPSKKAKKGKRRKSAVPAAISSESVSGDAPVSPSSAAAAAVEIEVDKKVEDEDKKGEEEKASDSENAANNDSNENDNNPDHENRDSAENDSNDNEQDSNNNDRKESLGDSGDEKKAEQTAKEEF